MIPEINKKYYFFDDGKITESRRELVEINAVIPFIDANDELINDWKEELSEIDWIYNPETDYFIRGYLMESKQNVVFVRTLNNGWFSLGWYAGRLDIDETLNKRLLE